MGWPQSVQILEVGPRDGLQNEAAHVPTAAKVHYVELLASAGFSAVEVTSFVRPGAVPQLADADEVLRSIEQRPGQRYPVLVPNPRGLERALKAGARDIALFTAATESFCRANINRTIRESMDDARAVTDQARSAGLRVRAYISVVFACPYEGSVAPHQVVRLAEQLLGLGVDEIGLGDTIGVGTPGEVERLLDRCLRLAPADRWGMHFHDTRGTALANVVLSMQLGVTKFDSASGGLGGCPFAGPSASGNLATEDLVYLLDGMRIQHGVDLDGVMAASQFISGFIGRPLTSKVYQAGGRLRPRVPASPGGS